MDIRVLELLDAAFEGDVPLEGYTPSHRQIQYAEWYVKEYDPPYAEDAAQYDDFMEHVNVFGRLVMLAGELDELAEARALEQASKTLARKLLDEWQASDKGKEYDYYLSRGRSEHERAETSAKAVRIAANNLYTFFDIKKLPEAEVKVMTEVYLGNDQDVLDWCLRIGRVFLKVDDRLLRSFIKDGYPVPAKVGEIFEEPKCYISSKLPVQDGPPEVKYEIEASDTGSD